MMRLEGSLDTRNGATLCKIPSRRMMKQSATVATMRQRDHNCSTTPARSLRQISAHLNMIVSFCLYGLIIWLLLCFCRLFIWLLLLLFSFLFFIFIFFALFYALVVFVNVCKQWGPHPPKEHSST
jgi:hypothetical protein